MTVLMPVLLSIVWKCLGKESIEHFKGVTVFWCLQEKKIFANSALTITYIYY